MSLAVVTLKKGEGRLLKSGGMWIFDNEIASVMGSFVNGDIVLVHDFDGYPLGRGFINTNSKIVVRLLSRDENTMIDEEFFEKRVWDAWEYRKKVTDTSSCRVISERLILSRDLLWISFLMCWWYSHLLLELTATKRCW